MRRASTGLLLISSSAAGLLVTPPLHRPAAVARAHAVMDIDIERKTVSRAEKYLLEPG